MSQEARIGSEIAGYRIDALLGRGGMGVVYLATDLRLKRRAALKVLAPELAADASFRERFISESVLAASLDHPNVIPVFEAGEVDGLLFIAMRYVRTTDDPKPNITGGADVLAAGSLGVAAIGQPGLRIRFDDFKVVAQ